MQGCAKPSESINGDLGPDLASPDTAHIPYLDTLSQDAIDSLVDNLFILAEEEGVVYADFVGPEMSRYGFEKVVEKDVNVLAW